MLYGRILLGLALIALLSRGCARLDWLSLRRQLQPGVIGAQLRGFASTADTMASAPGDLLKCIVAHYALDYVATQPSE